MISIIVKIGMGPDEHPEIVRARYLVEECSKFSESPKALRGEKMRLIDMSQQLESLVFNACHPDDAEEFDEVIAELKTMNKRASLLIHIIKKRGA